MELLDKLNIKYKNIKLYESALAHSSYVNDKGTGESYERLEFYAFEFFYHLWNLLFEISV